MKQIEQTVLEIGKNAKAAAIAARRASTADKNRALEKIVLEIIEATDEILSANALDIAHATEQGLDAASLDRLALGASGVAGMVEGLQHIIGLQDPVGAVKDLTVRPNGLNIGKMRTPLGVIGMIYESRPNVTIDAAGLCLKSGNAVILRGGSECIVTNQALSACIQRGLIAADLNPHWVQLIQTTDRAAVGELLALDTYVDLIIPRGGKSLIERVARDARIPVLKHLDGICHLYIHEDANLEMAHALIMNAKTHRYAVCNAMETLLLHKDLPASFVDEALSALIHAGVEVRACERTRSKLTDVGSVQLASAEDWVTEYLGPILSVKTCADLDDAIAHINHYGSNHTDAIVTESLQATQTFMREVDSSSVMVNASTRFADGFEYGLGAEIGISTDKLHARGPVGLEGLTSEKYVVYGTGQIRA
ncbi:MAG: glutamate-5-semialdehyde dehydrogenase [Pseudomonadales bacterium]|jgi:glutamate-5-semialdehyde dehydrogenase|nr:glutamate-5-semialdehyde dehydrogenase [Pseudomonadales bacterium]MDA0760122.1 glutamate-5-semialdehyde dehydrogenase [Pseudomonadota bacterium]MDA0957311.1 glutamate-5-semialdehyde dehydrogenase [Pseudomonadota bacterium]